MTTVETEATDIISPCPGCVSEKGAHIRIIKRPKKKSVPSDRMVKIPRSWDEISNPDVNIPGRKIRVQKTQSTQGSIRIGTISGKKSYYKPAKARGGKRP